MSGENERLRSDQRRWRCAECGKEVVLSYEELADSGNPICGEAGCLREGDEMDMMDTRPVVKVIVSMFGGTIDSVYVDNAGVNVTDVIFLEDKKYADDTYDAEHLVRRGELEGSFVYTHHEAAVLSPEQVADVVELAEARVRNAGTDAGAAKDR